MIINGCPPVFVRKPNQKLFMTLMELRDNIPYPLEFHFKNVAIVPVVIRAFRPIHELTFDGMYTRDLMSWISELEQTCVRLLSTLSSTWELHEHKNVSLETMWHLFTDSVYLKTETDPDYAMQVVGVKTKREDAANTAATTTATADAATAQTTTTLMQGVLTCIGVEYSHRTFRLLFTVHDAEIQPHILHRGIRIVAPTKEMIPNPVDEFIVINGDEDDDDAASSFKLSTPKEVYMKRYNKFAEIAETAKINEMHARNMANYYKHKLDELSMSAN